MLYPILITAIYHFLPEDERKILTLAGDNENTTNLVSGIILHQKNLPCKLGVLLK